MTTTAQSCASSARRGLPARSARRNPVGDADPWRPHRVDLPVVRGVGGSVRPVTVHDVLGRVGLPEPVRRAGRARLGRRRRRRRPQRAHRGRVPRARGRPCSCSSAASSSAARARSSSRSPTPRFVVSPCAYLVGLLHPLVIERARPAASRLPHLRRRPDPWTPFEDGTSLTQWLDDARHRWLSCAALAAARRRRVTSPTRSCSGGSAPRCATGARGDTWVGDAPDRAELDELFADDPEALDVLLDASIADVVERHVARRAAARRAARPGRHRHVRRARATPAPPRSTRMHAWALGRRRVGLRRGRDRPGVVRARRRRPRAGAVLAAGVPVAAIEPGRGRAARRWRADPGRRSSCRNADPVRTLGAVRRRDVPAAFAGAGRRLAHRAARSSR